MKPFILFLSMQLVAVPAAFAAAPPAAMEAPAIQAPPTAARILAPGNSPYTANTAKEFADTCKLDPSSCSAMVGQVLMDRIQFSPTSHICLPGVSYANAIGPWLDTHPDAQRMPARDGIYLALTTIYKCGPPNNY